MATKLASGNHLCRFKRKSPIKTKKPDYCGRLFQGGYIDAWGRGTLKIITACKEAELPEPEMKEEFGGVMVTIFKDRYTERSVNENGIE